VTSSCAATGAARANEAAAASNAMVFMCFSKPRAKFPRRSHARIVTAQTAMIALAQMIDRACELFDEELGLSAAVQVRHV
jgi:hypothetical protein